MKFKELAGSDPRIIKIRRTMFKFKYPHNFIALIPELLLISEHFES
jgi:hypothetical protein